MEKWEHEVSIFQRSCGVRWWCSVNSFSEIERRRKDDFLNCIDQDTLWRCFINFHCWPFYTTIRLDKCDSLKCMSASVWHLFIYFLNSYKYSCTLQLVCLITLFLLNVFSQLFNSLLFFLVSISIWAKIYQKWNNTLNCKTSVLLYYIFTINCVVLQAHAVI